MINKWVDFFNSQPSIKNYVFAFNIKYNTEVLIDCEDFS